MSALGSSALREIVFVIASGTADLTYEAVEAAIARVRKIEEVYAVNPAAVTDLTAATVVLTGKTPFKVFIFTATTVKATGSYTFALEEVAPNVETSTVLNA